jgi:hypothetical protein
MTVSDAIKDQFTHNYSKVLVQTWTDKNFFSTLETNPAQTLTNYGIPTEANTKINIITNTVDDSASLDDMINKWFEVQPGGTYDLYIPTKPQLGSETSAGAGDLRAQDDYCCCCCPCCTCT